MIKKIILFFVFIMFLSFTYASTLEDSISRMHENWLTIYDNTTDFKSYTSLRRDEAAKFFVKFSKLKWKETYIKTTNECQFSDINESRSDLKDIVIESCRLWLFQWNKGKFNPKDNLTNAQWIVVLMRIIDGRQDEKLTKNWYDAYVSRSSIWNILDNTAPFYMSSNITRANMAIMIYNWRLVDPDISPLTKTEVGLIKQVYIDPNWNKKLEIDYIQFWWQSNCGWWVTCIINQNSKLRTFLISENTEVYFQTLSHTSNWNFNGNQKVSLTYFIEKFNDTSQYDEYPYNYSSYLKAIPYQITIENNIIVKIEEIYMS